MSHTGPQSPDIAASSPQCNTAARRQTPTPDVSQFALDFDARTAARRSDPATSHAAARAAEKFATSHAGRIHAALTAHGPRTAHELSLLIGLSVVQIDRRLPDLKSAGLARVVKLDDGADKVVGGFRVWESVAND